MNVYMYVYVTFIIEVLKYFMRMNVLKNQLRSLGSSLFEKEEKKLLHNVYIISQLVSY